MRADPRPASTARVVHGALVASVLLWAAGHLALQLLGPPHAPPLPSGLGVPLRGVFLGAVAVVTLLGVRARKRLTAPRLVEDPDVFWRENRPALYGAWLAAELGAIAGVVLAWLTGVAFMGVGLPAVALLALLLASPRALLGRPR